MEVITFHLKECLTSLKKKRTININVVSLCPLWVIKTA